MISKKAFLKETTAYLILGFLPMGINFIMAPIYSHYLVPAQYGLIGIADLVGGFAGVFIAFGIKQAFARFYFDYLKEPEEQRKLMSTTVVSMLVMGLLFSLVGYFTGDLFFSLALNTQEFTFSRFGIAVIGNVTFTLLNEVFLSFYRNEENIKAYAVHSLGFFLCSLTGIITGVIVLEAGAEGNIWGRFWGILVYCLVIIPRFFQKNGFYFIKSYWQKMAKYGLPLIPYSLLLFVFHKTDIYWIEQSLGISELGVYSFVIQISAVFSVLIYSLFNAISPKIYRFLAGDSDYTRDFILKLNSLFAIAIFVIILIGTVAIKPVFHYFISPKYEPANEFAHLVFLIYAPQVLYVITTVPIFFTKKTKALPIIIFLSELLLLGSLFTEPLFDGVQGVAASVLVARVLQVFLVLVSLKILKIENVLNFQVWRALSTMSAIIAVYLLCSSIKIPKIAILNSSILVSATLSIIIILVTYLKLIQWGIRNLKMLVTRA